MSWDRKQYLAGEVSHEDYYGQFVNPELIAYVVGYIGAERILASSDPHMNDIPLAAWDWLVGVKDRIDTKLFKACNNATYPEQERDKPLWSLSDQVCIAKRAARAWREAQGGAQ